MFKLTYEYTDLNKTTVEEYITALDGYCDPISKTLHRQGTTQEGWTADFTVYGHSDVERAYRHLIAGTVVFYSVEFIG